jgi:rod shape-determining protein MreC
MENLLHRYRNVSILIGILFAQVLGLAIQVRRTSGDESSRLIRVWTVGAITPVEKAIVWLQNGTGNLWREYVYLRGVRQENRDLKMEIERLRLERVRLSEDAEQARRLQALLAFKEQFVAKTVAAQVIGSSGSEQSRSVFIDKGSDDGITSDMAVITAEGVVGKVLHVFGSTAQVLLINDQSSGVGAILENSRIQGVLKGTPLGDVVLERVMSDETVSPGEEVLTSGGDLIFPKGLPVGTVTKVNRTAEAFLNVQIKPAANLSKLEEVLVVVQQEQRIPALADNAPKRAADILARRLPSVPDKPADDKAQSATPVPAQPNEAAKPKLNTTQPKPQGTSTPGNTTAETTPPKKTEAAPPAPAVVKISQDATKQPASAQPKPATAEPKPQAEEGVKPQ